MTSRALLVSIALLALGTSGASTAATADGPESLRVLVIRGTWGPTPPLRDPEVFAKADAFIRRASFGRIRLEVELTPWLAIYEPTVCPFPATPRSRFGRVGELAQDAAAAAGYDLATYDRLAYVLPDFVCGSGGGGTEPELMLAIARGSFDAYLFVHELGHSFGLLHAAGSTCPLSCFVHDVGDPLSPMGSGFVDFSAYEKARIGWISNVATAERRGTYLIGSSDVASRLPQAIVLDTSAGEYWLEYRAMPPTGLVVRLVRRVGARTYVQPIYLGRVQRRFVAPGAFSVRVVKRRGAAASLAISFLDR